MSELQQAAEPLEELSLEEDRTSDGEESLQASAVDGATQRRIFTSLADPTVKDLYDRYKDGDLILQPDFQRYFIWDRRKSSRLVESLLLEVPLPIIYLAEESDGRESVIDGQQRLTSLFDFIDGKYALSGIEVRRDLMRKHYPELDKGLQGKIRKSAIRAITIKRESDDDLKFEIFERLNSGAVALNDQELRNCVYRGPYNDSLRELAEDPDFRFLLGLQGQERRMIDVQLVLRFAAFYHSTYLQYKPPIRQFLNRDMAKYQYLSGDEAAELRQAFKKSVALTRSLLTSNAFKRFYKGDATNHNGYWERRKFNASLYDVEMYGFTLYDKNQVMRRLDAIREALIALMTEDQDFIDSIELSTSSVKMVTRRFDKWRQTLQAVVGSPDTEPRTFSRQLKDNLFAADKTCSICGQRIQDVDDAAVDHVEQYWMGGRTIPENARLTHRYCNWSRARTDVVPPA